MINGFVDLFDVSVAKVFAGAGIGMSMIKGKLPAQSSNCYTCFQNQLKRKITLLMLCI